MSQPRREDVESIPGILKALYESISGPAGPRDWDRLRSLFVPAGRLLPARSQEDGRTTLECLDLESYIASRSPYLGTHPLHEVEVERRIECFGHIAQVWSSYEGYRTLEEKPWFHGANSVQLLCDGDRWWIVSVFCYNELDAPDGRSGARKRAAERMHRSPEAFGVAAEASGAVAEA